MGNTSSYIRSAADDEIKWNNLKDDIHTDILRFNKRSTWVFDYLQQSREDEWFNAAIKRDHRYEKFCHDYSRLCKNMEIWLRRSAGLEKISIHDGLLTDSFGDLFYTFCKTVHPGTDLSSTELFDVSHDTAEQHVQHIYRKLFPGDTVWNVPALTLFMLKLTNIDAKCIPKTKNGE